MSLVWEACSGTNFDQIFLKRIQNFLVNATNDCNCDRISFEGRLDSIAGLVKRLEDKRVLPQFETSSVDDHIGSSGAVFEKDERDL